MDTSDGFRELLSSALDEYKERTGIDLRAAAADTNSASLFQCATTTDVLREFGKSMEAFSDFRKEKSQRVWKRVQQKLDGFMKMLLLFNDSLAEMASSLSAPGGKAIFVAFHVLLKATKANDERLEQVVVLLSKLHSFFERLRVYLGVRNWEKYLRETFVKMLILVIESLAIATAEMRRGRLGRMKDALLGNQDLVAALQKFEELISQEHLMVSAWTLASVGRLLDEIIPQIMDKFKAYNDPEARSSEPSNGVRSTLSEDENAPTARSSSAGITHPLEREQNLFLHITDGDQGLLFSIVVAATVCAANGTTRAALATGFLCWFYSTMFSIPRTNAKFGKVIFVDVFGEKFSIDTSSCSTPESLHEFLLKISQREEKRESRSYVLAKKYCIEDADNGGVITPESWHIEACMRIEMAIILKTTQSTCPWCQRVVVSTSHSKYQVFECCGRQFSLTTVKTPQSVLSIPQPELDSFGMAGCFRKLHLIIDVKPLRPYALLIGINYRPYRPRTDEID